MKIELFAEGKPFTQEGLSIDETIQALSSFSAAYRNCLDIATDHAIQKSGPRPTLKISHIKPGSLDSQFFVDLTGAMASLMPLVPDYIYKMICANSWDLFIKTVKTAIAMAKHFYETKSPINYTVNNYNIESGGIVNVGQSGGSLSVNQTLDESIRKNFTHISKLAELINNQFITHISAKTDADSNNISDFESTYDLTTNASKYFSIQEIETNEGDHLELKCRVFSINRKSNNGRLDYFDEVVGPKPIPFTISSGDINDYIEAMKHDISIVTASRKFVVNALGEKRVTHLFLSSISIP